ncbi:MAG: serine/threonine protein kinase [Proteobacteria bacterium]|nr:serine/threonine protein kinase [Pseudomonadota bacterium]
MKLLNHPSTGDVLDSPRGRFRLLGVSGLGGSATVYRAWDLDNKREVAIKILRRVEQMSRAQQEARLLMKFDHPGIVRVYGAFTIRAVSDGAECETLAMVQSLESGPRFHRLLGGRRNPPARVCGILDQVLDALDYAHGRGVIHRDIKPDNLSLAIDGDQNDVVKVLDFGIAKVIDPAPAAIEFTLPHTGTHEMLGTPCYMAPEQMRPGHFIDARTDLYAVATVGYELVTGRAPFDAAEIGDLLQKKTFAAAPSITQFVPQGGCWVAELDEVLATNLAGDPRNRHATARDMRQAVQRVMATFKHKGPAMH